MQDTADPAAPGVKRRATRVAQWPTLLVAAAIYSGFALLTWFYHALPWWLVLPAGAYVVAWHGSLQHEAVHGHPTRWKLLNELLVFPSLWLWMPYRVYLDTHLTHHREPYLTDPLDDPESYYRTADHWRECGRARRAMLRFHNTVTGRLLIGPWLATWELLRHEMPRVLRGERGPVIAWALHVPACAIVLYWAIVVCDIPVVEYVLFFAWPGTALTMLRSFAEHRAVPDPKQRSTMVEASWPMALVFLNNNLHAAHHLRPGLAWYRLPGFYRRHRDAILKRNGGYFYPSYLSVIARYFLQPKEPVPHPLRHRPAGRTTAP